MNGREQAIAFANRVLDNEFQDPDRSTAVLARQFLRAIETTELASLRARVKELEAGNARLMERDKLLVAKGNKYIDEIDQLERKVEELEAALERLGERATVRETGDPVEWLWYANIDGKPAVTFGRWPKIAGQQRYKLAAVQPTEHDHPSSSTKYDLAYGELPSDPKADPANFAIAPNLSTIERATIERCAKALVALETPIESNQESAAHNGNNYGYDRCYAQLEILKSAKKAIRALPLASDGERK